MLGASLLLIDNDGLLGMFLQVISSARLERSHRTSKGGRQLLLHLQLQFQGDFCHSAIPLHPSTIQEFKEIM
jgi:hypothetical protein